MSSAGTCPSHCIWQHPSDSFYLRNPGWKTKRFMRAELTLCTSLTYKNHCSLETNFIVTGGDRHVVRALPRSLLEACLHFYDFLSLFYLKSGKHLAFSGPKYLLLNTILFYQNQENGGADRYIFCSGTVKWSKAFLIFWFQHSQDAMYSYISVKWAKMQTKLAKDNCVPLQGWSCSIPGPCRCRWVRKPQV